MDLNWTDEQYEQYEGQDLILGTGVPGSKWSGILKAINVTDEVINMSNDAIECKHGLTFYHTQAKTNKHYGFHYGTYWGPYHELGKTFDNIHLMSKKDIIIEFAKAFQNWDKLKLVKSHWFLYHLDFLIDMFPKVRIIGCYLPDDISFRWWHKLGGWDITYPPYDWYVDDTKMQEDIKIGNALLIKFFAERGIEMKAYKDFFDVFNDLNVHIEDNAESSLRVKRKVSFNGILGGVRKVPGSTLGIYTPSLGHTNTNKYLEELKEYDTTIETIFDILQPERK